MKMTFEGTDLTDRILQKSENLPQAPVGALWYYCTRDERRVFLPPISGQRMYCTVLVANL